MNKGRWMGDPNVDRVEFNNYRTEVWKALREEYPNKFSPSTLSIDKLKTDENPAAFVETASANWRARMEQDPEDNHMIRSMFRKAVLEAVPTPAKEGLEKLWNLGTMSKDEFREAVSHHVGLSRATEESKSKQDTEAQRKLVHSKLADLKGTKKTVQAPVVTQGPAAEEPQGTVPAQQLPPSPMSPPPAYYPGYNPPPYWALPMGYPPPMPFQGRGGPRPGGVNRGRGNNRGGYRAPMPTVRPPFVCFTCQQSGQIARDCPHWPPQGGAGSARAPRNEPTGLGGPSPYGGVYY